MGFFLLPSILLYLSTQSINPFSQLPFHSKDCKQKLPKLVA